MRSPYRDRLLQGYTIVELLVVLVIIGILSSQLVWLFLAPENHLKAAVFSLRTDFNLARSEAVNRNRTVCIGFSANGYKMWLESSLTSSVWYGSFDPAPPDDAAYYGSLSPTPAVPADAADELLPGKEDVSFPDGVQLYDTDLGAVGGPDKNPDGTVPIVITDGVELDLGDDSVCLDRRGEASQSGNIYLYMPATDGTIKAGPYAVTINILGSIKVWRWVQSSNQWSAN